MKAKTVVRQGKARSSETANKAAPTAPATPEERAPASKDVIYTRWAIAGLVAAVLACYVSTLWNGFVFDDHIHALDDPMLRSLSNLPRLLLSYRPLRDISYAIDFAIWGQSPAGFHFTNVAIHACNTVLVFLLIKRFMRGISTSILPPLLAALIFALHPLQTDAVAYVSGRRDVLFALFYLAGLHFYLTYRASRSWKYLVLFLGSWGLSLLSKEMAASFPFVIFAWSFCELWGESSGKWLRKLNTSAKGALLSDRWLYLGLAIAGLVYTFYQTYTRGGSERAGYRGFRYWGGSFYHNMLTVAHVHLWYFKQLIWPTPITQYSGAFPVATSIWDHLVIVSAVMILALIGLGVWLLDRSPLASFAIFSYFLMLLPVSHIIPHHELLADHYLYLPIMSFGLLVAIGFDRLAAIGARVQVAVWATAALAMIVFGVLTIRQGLVWHDDYSLWQANYAAVPDSPRAAYSMGVEYISRNPRKAVELFRQAVSLDPSFSPPYLDLAMVSNGRDQEHDAETVIRTGLQIPDQKLYNDEGQSPRSFRSNLTVALALARDGQGDHQGAEKLMWQAIALQPDNAKPYDFLAGHYQKDDAKLRDVLNRELKAIPNSDIALQRMSVLLLKASKYDEAVPYVRRLLRINPNDVFANFQLSQIYRTEKDCSSAWYYFKIAQAQAVRQEDLDDLNKSLKQMTTECPNK
ncbi:MAG TPA: hypothetical protein VI756_22460 [Blastocatellia bacterium]